MRQPKIGMLTGGYFEYWRMYPGLEKQVEAEMQGLYQKLNGKLEVVWSSLADTTAKCDAAGKKFKEEDIDLLVICEGSYFPDYMPIQTAEYLPGVPILLLLTQPHPYVPQSLDYQDAIHHSFGLVGVVQLSGALRKMGRTFEILISSLDDDSLADEVVAYANVAAVYRKLRFLNLGIIGHTFQGMYDLELDKTSFKSRIGPNVIYVELNDLLNVWEKIPAAEGDRLASKVLSQYRLEGPNDADVRNACRLGLAMERLASMYSLDGISHLCQHFLHLATGTTPCYANSMLIDKGVMVSCEGDIGNLAMMCVLHALTGGPVHHGEFGMYDVTTDTLLFMHHGSGSPQFAARAADVRITPTGERWGFKGAGASFRYVAKPGPVTLTSLLCDRDGWKMMITGGEVVEAPLRPFYGEQFNIRLNLPVKDWLYRLCREGVTHHAALAYGDVRRELVWLADLLKVRKFVP